VYNFGTVDEMLDAVGKMSGHEGIVVYSEGGQRLHKVKSVEYLLAHKIRYGLRSPVKMWEAVSEGKFEEVLATLPEGCRDDFEGFGNTLLARKKKLEQDALQTFSEIRHLNRKEFALEACKYNYRGTLFAMLDGKSYEHVLWSLLKP
jgi:hypothetical protein